MNKEVSMQEFLNILKEVIEKESTGLALDFSNYSTNSKLKDIGLDSLDVTLTLISLGSHFSVPSNNNNKSYTTDVEIPKAHLTVMDLIVWINKYNNTGVSINVS
jgi:acyl carrier protein